MIQDTTAFEPLTATAPPSPKTPALGDGIDAVLFDLDGVLTPTAQIHEEAWRRLFGPYFESRGVAPYTDEDYFVHLDGRARYDAVEAILASRGIDLPYGQPDDDPDQETICGLGNRKNREFNEAVRSTGVTPYPGSTRFLDYIERLGPLKVAVVSSSKNAPAVLESAGLLDHFSTIVDGNVARDKGLGGKPAPDTYLDAARQLGVDPSACAVVEDAVSGVQAGHAGDFGMVIGVDRGAGAQALRSAGATIVVNDLGELVPAAFESRPGANIPARYPVPTDPEWVIPSHFFSERGPQVQASLLALTNGYLGIRGDMGLASDTSDRGTYLNGLHETWPIAHAEDAYGFARIGQSMVSLPDATSFQVMVDGFAWGEGGIVLCERTRTLDVHSGLLVEQSEWIAPSGAAVRIEQRSAVALFNPHLAVIEIAVTPLDRDCEIVIRSSVATPTQPPVEVSEGIFLELDDPRKANPLIEGAVIETEVFGEEDGASIAYQTRASHMAAALALKNRAHLLAADSGAGGETNDEAGASIPMRPVETCDGESLAWETCTAARRGQTVQVTKTLSYTRDDLFEERPGEPLPRADAALKEALADAPDTFFINQATRTGMLWSRGDVQVDLTPTSPLRPGAVGTPSGDSPTLQASIRWCLFQLLQASACLRGTGVPAKGLTGSGYDGHYFWDAEIYVLPYLVYANPEAARELLHYRYRTLDAARVRAAEMNEDGALFSWRTIGGPEASAYYPAGTAQYHIDAAIAYALNQYLNATDDTNFLLTEAIDILVETSRMWLSLGFLSGRDGKFHIQGVTGPDEYTAVVNDNLYTNVMARANLRVTSHWLEVIKENFPTDYEAIIRRLALSSAQISEFAEVADAIYVPWNETLGLYPQDDAFLDKQVWDFEGTPAENYPLLLHYHPLVIYRHQVLKQSDTVLALYLLASQFSTEDKRANFDYYDAITTGDSSLSAAAQSIVAAEVGHAELAADYFSRLLEIDLSDLHSNTDAGLHIASLGGTWSALVMGFGGLRDDTGILRFSPRLPVNWASMRFSLMQRGYPLKVAITRGGIDFEYDAPEGAEVTVAVVITPGVDDEDAREHLITVSGRTPQRVSYASSESA